MTRTLGEVARLVHREVRADDPARARLRLVTPDAIDATTGRIEPRPPRVSGVDRGAPDSGSTLGFEAGELLYVRLRAVRVATPDFAGRCSTSISVLAVHGCDAGWLAWWLRSPEAVAWADAERGGARPRVKASALLRMPLPEVPPPLEQRLLALRLERALEAWSRAEAAAARRLSAIERLERALYAQVGGAA